jgi:uncharacterized protein YidB (DUF937 family)
MTDIGKLSILLDDPEVRELIFGLAHVRSIAQSGGAGAARLRAVVLDLASTTSPEQYSSWLSDEAVNMAMTAHQVRMTIGDDAVNDLALLANDDPTAIAWQLAEVLPDFVDAVSPGGVVIDATVLDQEIADASELDDRSAGAFGSHFH